MLGWFAYFIAFLAFFFGGGAPSSVGLGITFLVIGMIIHWRFWSMFIFGAIVGFLVTRN